MNKVHSSLRSRQKIPLRMESLLAFFPNWKILQCEFPNFSKGLFPRMFEIAFDGLSTFISSPEIYLQLPISGTALADISHNCRM